MAADACGAMSKRIGKTSYPHPDGCHLNDAKARVLEKRGRTEPRFRVRFLLPDGGESKQKVSTYSNPTLPSICELATFNTNMKKQKTLASAKQGRHHSRKSCADTRWRATDFGGFELSQGRPTRGVSSAAEKRTPKCSIQEICDESSRFSTDQKFAVHLACETSYNVVSHGMRKCAIKELCIDTTRCKLPEDYKEPSREDKFIRIMNWLRESQEALPPYKRRTRKST